jgi:hypothetical protein
MHKELERIVQFGLLFLVIGLGLTACPNSVSTTPPNEGASIAADGGLVQISNWSASTKGTFYFPDNTLVSNLNTGTIDADGKIMFKLPTPYPADLKLLKVTDLIGTGCTVTPADSAIALTYLYLQIEKASARSASVIKFSPSNDGLLHVDDEIVQWWVYAPKSFSVKGAKGCGALFPKDTADISFTPGWNYLIQQLVSVSSDGKTVLEGNLKVLSVLPSQFQWSDLKSANTVHNPVNALGSR